VGQLTKNHAQKLAPATEAFYIMIAPIALNTLIEFVLGNIANQLRKNIFSLIHREDLSRDDPISFILRPFSNRKIQKHAQTADNQVF
jgi:hypothetical protein